MEEFRRPIDRKEWMTKRRECRCFASCSVFCCEFDEVDPGRDDQDQESVNASIFSGWNPH